MKVGEDVFFIVKIKLNNGIAVVREESDVYGLYSC
jgi:hypothetical protein